MNQAQTQNDSFQVGRQTDIQLKSQLMREINCLERHLDRLRTSGYTNNQSTLDTYREMISSRKDLLSELS